MTERIRRTHDLARKDAPVPISRREFAAFSLALAALVALFLHESLFLGRVLSSADVVYAQPGFRDQKPESFVPSNRLLMDPVLQVEPWLAWSRSEIRQGRWPLWNPLVGGGAPHIGNGQSAVFDPFHVIAYVGDLPTAHAWMAAARLWVAGIGMYLLACAWGLSTRARWFAGLCYPFCGFLILWLLYPPTSSAVWLPWMLLGTTLVLDKPTSARVVFLALVTAFTFLCGHVQTSAHNLLAVGAYAAWRLSNERETRGWRFAAWTASITLGLLLASVQLISLAAYLGRSPAWSDREREHTADSAALRPRPLDAACNAFPLIFGSQRRGQPNLGRALGVHNLNESAGGYAGLATLVWLAPLGWRRHRRRPLVKFLTALALVSLLIAYAIPPFAQLAHALPILRVMDHRRLVHLSALAILLLAAHAFEPTRTPIAPRTRPYTSLLLWALAAILLAGAFVVPIFAPKLRSRLLNHYESAADASLAQIRTDRQLADLTGFLPAYLALSALHCVAIGWLAWRSSGRSAPNIAIALVVVDLFAFGYGHNPAIARADYRPSSPLIEHLRRVAPPPGRILALGDVLPPNMLMRYGLSDIRNYDSVELASYFHAFDSLYEPDPERHARTSRREVTWDGVSRAKNALRRAGVTAIVATTSPPEGLFTHIDNIGECWVGLLESTATPFTQIAPDEIHIDASSQPDQAIVLPVTYDPGWRAERISDQAAQVLEEGGSLAISARGGARRIILRYDPPEFRLGLSLSIGTAAVLTAWLVLGVIRRRRLAPSDQGWDARAAGTIRYPLPWRQRSPHRPLREGTR